MKILYVQDSLGTGGAERSNADLWYYLQSQPDVHLKIVVLEHRKVGIEQEILEAGFDVTFLKNGNLISQARNLAGIIEEFEPDLVQSVLFRSAIRVRLAKQFISFFHLEYIVNCSYSKIRYNDPKINNLGLSAYKYLNRYTQSKGVDHFIALTEEVKNHASNHLKIKPSKITVIPRGRSKNRFLAEKDLVHKEIREELNIDEDAILFVHVGRQEYQKAQTDLLEAIYLIDDELKKLKSHFIFCGRKGNLTSEIKEYLNNNDIQTPIDWLGHRNDIQEILLAADVFVFPSLYEGLGGSLIEAQAAGLPIIASNIKVFEEVVREDFNATLFETSNTKDLAAKLKFFATSKELREKYGKNSLENYNEKFQIDDIHNRIFNLYKDLIN
ncbi:glycosyltransferase family 4 protein [Gramella lutea]|uniref:Glycosyltransferase family 4 protein n=1 Tax=Christiangramia lutea TaxID=1607951 RepID=A0A9X1V426_9FLAO|nr:glycosyltransferase family 4 protein [Christiangramia lutea]MCH4823804.1 glycosyltransferase family 4 protein [Christiangramia lutea]